MIKMYFDGCCEPINPGGTAGWGVVIIKDGKRWEKSGMIPASPQTSNNVGEYSAFLAGIKVLLKNRKEDEEIEVMGDSKLVINQVSGLWNINKGLYVPLAQDARALVDKFFSNITFHWIPREENYIADELSKAELKKAGIEFRIQPEVI